MLETKQNTIPLFRFHQLNQDSLYIDYENWYTEKLLCKKFDAIVYTADCARMLNCKRLITFKLKGETTDCPKTIIRRVDNVHTKLYIIYKKFGKIEVWMGSGNLVSSKAWHNLMMRVDDKYNKETLLEYFEWVWSAAGDL